MGGIVPISCTDVSNAISDTDIFEWYPYVKRSYSFISGRDFYDASIDYLNALSTACKTHDAGIAFGVLSWYVPTVGQKKLTLTGFSGVSPWY
jgi:hypothetical protein